jgi:hypothetical protein
MVGGGGVGGTEPWPKELKLRIQRRFDLPMDELTLKGKGAKEK